MIEVTQKILFEEIALAVFNDLRIKLLNNQENHCLRVDHLPNDVMYYACEKLNSDPKLKLKGLESYVLTNKKTQDVEVESGRLIELRNRTNFGILVIFIPQGFRGAAEDSYDIHTFESYDLVGVLAEHKKKMINAFSEEEQKTINAIISTSVASKQSIENHLKYLIALTLDECTWETAGAYLHYLNLIPDLKLDEVENITQIQARILRNGECVEILSDSDKTIFLALEAMVNKGFDSNHNNIREHLLSFFRNRNQLQKDKWTEEILRNDEWRKKLTFDKWKFRDLASIDVELYIDRFKDKEGQPLSGSGFTLEGDNLIATSASTVKVKWKTNPKKSPKVSQIVIILEREEESDLNNELHRKTAKGTSEQTAFAFKDVELEKGEEWLVHFRVVALDENKAKIAEDISEPFYLRGDDSDSGGTETKRYNKIRNLAEAVLLGTYKHRKQIEIESQAWETGRSLLYRIKTKPKETYQISLNDILHNAELKTLQDPYNCGAWEVDILNRGFIEDGDFKSVAINIGKFKELFNAFLDSRRELFHSITSHDDSAVLEILDLRNFKELIVNYANTYLKLTSSIKESISNALDAEVNNILTNTKLLNRLDTVHIKLGTTEEPEELVLMAPTHPLKVLWLLQYQQLLFDWSEKMIGMSEDQVRKAIDIENYTKILSLNIPNAISFEQDIFFVNTDTLDLYWGIYPKSTTKDIRKVVAQTSKALGYKDDLGNISSVSPTQIADRLWRYLKHHPYIKTLKINVLNPGDGLIFLNTIRELQKMDDFKNLRYDITFYGSLGYELMGNAFDDLMNETNINEGSISEVDDELLQPSHNPLFPKLFFSKVKVDPDKWSEVQFKESNVTVIIDQFATKTISRPTGNVLGSYFLHGLLAEYRSEFNILKEAVTWSRKVVPSATVDVHEEDEISQIIQHISSNFLGLSCAYFDWSKTVGNLPTIQLELSQHDRYILSQIHISSDWVFTIDRNLGIEYFDNPADAHPSLKSYLIDYTPEFMDGVGHRLIVSTGWLKEIEKLIEDGLKKINIPTTSFRAIKVLEIIKSVSGKLALKLINNPNNAREIIGLSLTRLWLEKNDMLKDSVLIPVDTHIDIFSQNKKRNVDEDVTVKRSDLFLISVKNKKLNINLIEVKFRSNEGNITESLNLKEEIFKKNENSEKAFKTKFISDSDNPKIDVHLTNKSLSTLIGFYFERAIRHGLCVETTSLKDMIEQINTGNFEINFEKSGFIYHWAGTTKSVNNYKNNQVYEIGHNDICELLEIRLTEEIEDNGNIEILEQETTTRKGSIKENIPPYPSDGTKDSEGTNSTMIFTDNTTYITVSNEEQDNSEAIQNLRIYLGKNVDTGKDIFFDPNTSTPKKLANQHLLIVGKSGAGKSQTTSAVLFELNKQNIPFLILDFQGEYIADSLTNSKGLKFLESTHSSVLDPSMGMEINPLEVSLDTFTGQKQKFMNNVYQVASTLKQIFDLGDIQNAILTDAIKRTYIENGFIANDKTTWNNPTPPFNQIWELLEFMEKNEGGNVKNLKYRIQPLFENDVFVNGDTASSIEKLLKHNTIIRLATLPTVELMKTVARFTLQSIYNKMLAEGPSKHIKLFVVIDEAHKLSYDHTLTALIRESRKYGIGFLLASQSVRDFATVVFENMGTKIALQLEGDDGRYMADNFGSTDKPIKDAVLKLLPNQQPLRALLRNNHFEPFVQIDIEAFYNK